MWDSNITQHKLGSKTGQSIVGSGIGFISGTIILINHPTSQKSPNLTKITQPHKNQQTSQTS